MGLDEPSESGGGVGDGIGHTLFQGHDRVFPEPGLTSSLATGADCLSKRQGNDYGLNEKVFHVNTYV